MALKALVKALEEVEEAHRGLYKKTEEGFILDIDEKGYQSKIKEFRDNNVELKKKIDEASEQMKKFEGVDPEKYQQALEVMAELQKTEEGKLIQAGKIDEVFNRRTQALKDNYEKQLQKIQKQSTDLGQANQALFCRMQTMVIESEIAKEVDRRGSAKSGALADIMNRATQVWKMNPDFTLATDKQDDKGNPLTVSKWVEGLVESAPHLFEGGTGAGSKGGQKKDTNNVAFIDAGDPVAFGKNLEAIASGKVKVRTGE